MHNEPGLLSEHVTKAGEKEFEVQFASLSDEHLPLLRSSHAGGGDGAYENLGNAMRNRLQKICVNEVK